MKYNVQIQLTTVCLVLLMIGCNTTPPPNPTVRDDIKVPAGATLFYTAKVDGMKHVAVQMYRCDSLAPGKYGWVFAGPEAELYNEKDELIGQHFKSPTGPAWQLKKDGSKVICKKAKEAPLTNPTAIPLFLLEAIGHEGTGDFNQVKWIQRVDTQGGITPTDTCNISTLGKIIRVPYKATYYFYK